MKGLIAADEQCRRFSRRNKHPVGVLERTVRDAIDPDGIGVASAPFRSWKDKIGNNGAAGCDNLVTHPAHAARMLDTDRAKIGT